VPATHNPPTGFVITLTEDERTLLLNCLEQRLRNKLVEEHRTDAFDFREYVLREVKVLETVIERLRGH
jgi:hypothetical protein